MMVALTAQRERAPASPPRALATQIEALDWARIAGDLDAHGCATTGPLLTAAQCAALAQTYTSDAPFRSRVVMARHGFGRGEYKYFAYPLPEPVAALRAALYPPLAEIANRWNEAMGIDRALSGTQHASYLARCHAAGQTQADAAAAAVRRRRLQLPAPGPLRRARVSAAGHGAAVATGRGFHRRRVRAHRAAAAHAVARRGRAARARARP